MIAAFSLETLVVVWLGAFLGAFAAGGAGFAFALAGGVLGGLGGYSGVLPTIWTQVRGWPKEVARGVYQPFIVFAQVVTLAIIGTITVDRAGIFLFLTTIPALALGALLGLRVYGRLNDRRFRRVLSVMLLLSGLTLFA
jgi:uncharacterized membrane protein YfcA